MDFKISEKNLSNIVLTVLLDKGPMCTTTLRFYVKEILKPTGANLIPLENRSDVAIDQIIRNIISHKENPSNIIYKGYVDYKNGILSITQAGIDVLLNKKNF